MPRTFLASHYPVHYQVVGAGPPHDSWRRRGCQTHANWQTAVSASGRAETKHLCNVLVADETKKYVALGNLAWQSCPQAGFLAGWTRWKAGPRPGKAAPLRTRTA